MPTHTQISDLCTALEDTAAFVKKSWNSEELLKNNWGWHHPALTRHDLAAIPSSLAKRLRAVSDESLDEETKSIIKEFPKRLKSLQSETIPYMFNGNGQHAVPAFIATLSAIESSVAHLFQWQENTETKSMPPALARRLRSLKAEIETLTSETADLNTSIKLINDAREASESLPVDMKALQDARIKIEKASTSAEQFAAKISANHEGSAAALKAINSYQQDTAKLVAQCEEAYRITTTKGLAASFQQSSSRLETTVWMWVIGLLAALAVGALLGAHRLESLTSEIQKATPNWSGVWMNALLSAISLGGPIWFAWLATKQIGQRFRLSEDYAFKAAVAKAYEGYRKEAARLSPEFESRLFDSALTRLDEPPLRWVESDSHGSPWHEFIESDAFKKALKAIPELGSTFRNLQQKKKYIKSKPELPSEADI